MTASRLIYATLGVSLLMHLYAASLWKPFVPEPVAAVDPPPPIGFKILPPKATFEPPAVPDLPQAPLAPPPLTLHPGGPAVHVDPHPESALARDTALVTENEAPNSGVGEAGGTGTTEEEAGPATSSVFVKASASDTALGNRPPAYPRGPLLAGVEGDINLQIWVNEDGSAGAIKVLSKAGDRELTEAARKTAKNWRYRAARRGGVAVASWLTLTINYRLDGGSEIHESAAQ